MIIGDFEARDNLIRWLEEKHPRFESNLSLRDVPGLERGMIASRKLSKGDTLLHIPASAMLNPLTLLPSSSIPSHLFPQTTSSRAAPLPKKPRIANPPRKLDTTQLLTLHLALTRDPKERYKSDWQVYIDSLPKSFRPWHPLTWTIPPSLSPNEPKEREAEGWEWWNNLYNVGISQSTKLKVQDVKQRFDKDYEVLLEVLKEEEPFKSQRLSEVIGKEDILWAWLNVNTRSISIPLGLPGPSERNNHTLVPIMDFINHSSNESIITPRVRQLPTPSSSRIRKPSMTTTTSNGTGPLPSPPLTSKTNGQSNGVGSIKQNAVLLPNKIDFQLNCPDRGLEENEEVFFEYGGHSSSTLFAEYGFCEVPTTDGVQDSWLDMKYGEVDLTSYIDELWKEQDQEDREEKKQVLEDIGCWGGNTLHSQPSPSHPSHSLLMTLRLIHLPASSPKLPNISKGLVTYVSPQNETSTLLTLEGICKKVIKEAKRREKVLAKMIKDVSQGGSEDVEKAGVLGTLSAMCEEELVICSEVLGRLEKGEDFS
uniref:SET domain-containing protein n=1 Tax=Kwoniella bestiolae CBS 10118 TaxID=1296100 RepID=A0A1B9FS10_9TREE|nr:hypothetical protein I302_09225 [Kwoniella bestiolae CBS 10118]OCF21546.1 hypothetical protein I302_09225 [Kwoniella bestiolae CBS 10118]